MLRILALFLLPCSLLFSGCSGDAGPPSISQTSTTTDQLSERIKTLETYVEFRRNYNILEYDIFFQNNGGGRLPGPSDWDIRLAAQVPKDEIDVWVSQEMNTSSPPKKPWYQKIVNEIDVSGVTEWHSAGGRSVGIDRVDSIVVYRNNNLGE